MFVKTILPGLFGSSTIGIILNKVDWLLNESKNKLRAPPNVVTSLKEFFKCSKLIYTFRNIPLNLLSGSLKLIDFFSPFELVNSDSEKVFSSAERNLNLSFSDFISL